MIMPTPKHLPIFLYFIGVLQFTNGFPGSNFIAKIAGTKTYRPQRNKIIGWNIRQIQGFKYVADKGFQAPAFGTYLISYAINGTRTESNAVFQACISINEGRECQALVSEYSQTSTAENDIILGATGVIQLFEEDHVSVHVSSNISWKLQSNSTFFSFLLHENGIAPAFYVHPRKEELLLPARSQYIKRWEADKKRGGFISTPSFSKSLGIFSIMSSGVYYISLNIIIKKHRGEDEYLLFLTKDNYQIISENRTATASVNIVTISVNIIVSLKRGTKLFMFLRQEGVSTSSVMPSSSYSVSMVQAALDGQYGFSVKSLRRISYLQSSKIDITKFARDMTGHVANALRDSTFLKSSGNYLLCVNFRVKCLKTSKCRMKYFINEQEVLPGIPGKANYIYVSGCTTMFLRTGAVAAFEVRTNAVQWFLEEGSTLSVMLLQELAIAFHLGSPAIEKENSVWIKVMGRQKFSRQQSSKIMLSYDTKQGEYIVRRTGIYFIGSNVILTSVGTATLSACIGINGVKTTDGLFATSTVVSSTHTLVISSAVYLKKGQHISLYVKVSGTDKWDLDPNTSLSAIYLGEKDLITGFHTTFISDITHKSSGWQTCINWNTPSYMSSMPWSFASGEIILPPTGKVEVQVAGLYYISATVILSDAYLLSDKSMFIAMITLNDETGSQLLFTTQSGKTNSNQHNVRSDVTLSLSGVVKLKKHDVVSLKVCSKSDSLWTVRKQTGFSIILVSRAREAAGFLVRYQNGSSTALTDNYGNWTYLGDDPKLFRVGKAAFPDEEDIHFTEQGVYMLSIKMQIFEKVRSSILLGISDQTTNQKIVCAKKSDVYRETFISCNMLLNCKAGDKIKVFVTSEEKRSRFTIGSASLSVLKIIRPEQIPWFYAELQESFQLLDKIKLSDWGKYSTGDGSLLGHLGTRHVNKVEREKSITRGYALVITNFIFDSISNGKCGIMLGETGASSSFSARYQFDSTKRFSKGVISSSHIMDLVSNGLELTLNANGSFIDKRSSFSMSYLTLQSGEELVRLQLNSNKMLNKSATLLSTEWSMIDTKRKLRDVWIKKNIIYLISIELIAELTGDTVNFSIFEEAGSLQKTCILTRHSLLKSTYSISGLFKATETGRIKVSVQFKNGKSAKLFRGSRINLVPLGNASEVTGLIVLLGKNDDKKKSNIMFDLLPKETKFSNGIEVIGDTMIIRKTGIYLVTADISVYLRGRATFDLFLQINGNIGSRIYTRQEIRSNGMVSFANSIRLQRGTFMTLRISIRRQELRFDILPISTLGIVMLNDLDYELQERLLPVVYKSVLSSSRHVGKAGHPLTLSCYAAADGKITYHWFRNRTRVASGEGNSIKLEGKLAESGDYYCEASASNAIAMSEPVSIEFYDANECEEGNHACIGGNQTCINMTGTYACGCDAGLFWDNGECKVASSASDVNKRKYVIKKIPIAVIVLVPIAILVSLFVVIVLIYTCYTNRKSTARRLLRQRGSFSEEITLHHEDFDSLCFDDSHCNHSDIHRQFTQMRTVNRIIGPDQVRFSFASDSDLDSTMDLRDDEYQSTSSI